MRVNLGAGDRYADGWHNVDQVGSPHRRDETVDLTGILPWTDVDYVYAGHVLEHLWVGEVVDLLIQLRECMTPHGELMIVGPDCVIAQAMAVDGTLDVTMDSLERGGHRWPGDEHRWQCTGLDVMSLLRVTGWTRISDVGINNVPAMWPVADRRPQWQCAILAQP